MIIVRNHSETSQPLTVFEALVIEVLLVFRLISAVYKTFNNLPSKENVKNPGKKNIIRRKQMLLDMLTGGFGNSINIWFFYRILQFSPFELLKKRHKNGEFQS